MNVVWKYLGSNLGSAWSHLPKFSIVIWILKQTGQVFNDIRQPVTFSDIE